MFKISEVWGDDMHRKTAFSLLSAAICAFLCTSCSSDDSPRYNQLDDADRKQGVWKYYDGNRNLTSHVTYVDDKRFGAEVLYYESGEVYAHNYWKSDSIGEYLDSVSITYHQNGNPALVSWYDIGEPVNEWTFYYETGTPRIKEHYKDGFRYGIWQYFRSDSTLELTIDYTNVQVQWQDDKRSGLYVWRDSTGDTSRLELWLADQLMEQPT